MDWTTIIFPLGLPFRVTLLSPSGKIRNSEGIYLDFSLDAIFLASCSDEGPPRTVKLANRLIEQRAILKF